MNALGGKLLEQGLSMAWVILTERIKVAKAADSSLNLPTDEQLAEIALSKFDEVGKNGFDILRKHGLI